MAETVGDFLLERLSQWGVKQVFGCRPNLRKRSAKAAIPARDSGRASA